MATLFVFVYMKEPFRRDRRDHIFNCFNHDMGYTDTLIFLVSTRGLKTFVTNSSVCISLTSETMKAAPLLLLIWTVDCAVCRLVYHIFSKKYRVENLISF